MLTLEYFSKRSSISPRFSLSDSDIACEGFGNFLRFILNPLGLVLAEDKIPSSLLGPEIEIGRPPCAEIQLRLHEHFQPADFSNFDRIVDWSFLTWLDQNCFSIGIGPKY